MLFAIRLLVLIVFSHSMGMLRIFVLVGGCVRVNPENRKLGFALSPATMV